MPEVQQPPLKCQDLFVIITQPDLQTQSLGSALTIEEELNKR